MIGGPESYMVSGFGAYQSNGNKKGLGFWLKSAINWVDQLIMGTYQKSTPAAGITFSPIFKDDKVSDDLQKAGYRQYQ